MKETEKEHEQIGERGKGEQEKEGGLETHRKTEAERARDRKREEVGEGEEKG